MSQLGYAINFHEGAANIWVPYTPIVAPAAGAGVITYTSSGKYSVIRNRLVHVNIFINITAVAGPAADITVSAPIGFYLENTNASVLDTTTFTQMLIGQVYFGGALIQGYPNNTQVGSSWILRTAAGAALPWAAGTYVCCGTYVKAVA